MLRPRVIPCLLFHNKGLYKTVKFSDHKYVGDPLNAVKIFNEKEVDELIFLDIDATIETREPNFEMIKNLAIECRMPLCYGGGVKTADHARRIIGLGAEKVALSSILIEKPEIVREIARSVGKQSVVAVIDIQKKGIFKKYEVVTHNAKRSYGINPIDFAKKLDQLGVGEIVINSVDQDGTMKGYDIELIEKIREAVDCPLTVLGGAGSYSDIKGVVEKFGIIGAAAGSLFVFKGIYKAVLINYLGKLEKENLLE